MPLYEYQCDACERRFEVIQKFSDPSPDSCRVCGKGPVRRLQSSPAIQFKGSGWYITDYAQKGRASAESAGESTAAGKETGAGAKTDSSSTDSPKTTTSAPASGAKSDASS